MKVAIERKRPQIKKWFGGTKEAGYESVFVSIAFTNEELQAIKLNRLHEFLVYEHPQDESAYDEGQELARLHPNSYGGQNPPPRYRRSRFVHHFIDNPTQEVFQFVESPMQYAEVQAAVQKNLQELKQLIEKIEAFPTDRVEIEI